MDDFQYKKNKLKNLQFEFSVTVKRSRFDEEKKSLLKKKATKVKLPGFRPGKAPLPMIESVLGAELLEDTLEHVLQEVAAEIINTEKLAPISRVKYKLEKFETENDIEFSFSFYNFPEFKLPDFTKLGASKTKDEVTDKEVDDLLTSFYKDVEKLTVDDEVDFTKIDEKWIEKLGIKEVKTLEELKKYMRTQLEHQKEHSSTDKFINELIEKAIVKADIEVPQEFIDGEVEARETTDKTKIENLGLKWEDWLRQQKTDVKNLKEKWAEETKKAYQTDFLLISIAKEKDLLGKTSEIEQMLDLYRGQKNLTHEEEDNLRLQLSNEITRRRAVDWILKQVS